MPEVFSNAPLLYTVTCMRAKTGSSVDPRGLKTLERRNVCFRLVNPALSFLNREIRPKYHPAIGIAEGLQMIAGISDPQLMGRIAPMFKDLAEEGGHLHGAYGPRLFECVQLKHVVDKLQADSNTRQAVCTIWSPPRDADSHAKDIPCTVDFLFSIRNGSLLMDVHMRSEDIWLGLPYDLLQFTLVQKTVSHILGIQAGPYTHYVNSFHVYERDLPKVNAVKVNEAAPATNRMGSLPVASWEEAMSLALLILSGKPVSVSHRTPFVLSCQRALEPYV